ANDYSFSQLSGSLSTSQAPVTGNATKFVTASGLTGGNGTIVCEDANGNLKDSGCSTSGGGSVLLSPGAGVDQTINQTSTSNLLVNRLNYFKSAAALGLQAAINDCANNPSSGCTVLLAPGTTTACNISVPAKVKLVGHGVNGSLLKCGTNNQPVLSITGNNAELYDFDVEHTVMPVAGGDGIVTCGGCDRLKIYDVRSANNYIGFNLGWVTYSELFDGIAEYNVSNGVQFTPDQTNKTNQWEVRGFLSEQNGGNGFDLTLNSGWSSWQGTCPHFSNHTQSFGNNGYGYNIDYNNAASSGIADCWFNGTFASQNNNSGYYLNLGPAGGRNAILTHVYSEQSGYSATTMPTYGYNKGCNGATCPGSPSNLGYGIEITANCDPTPGPIITGPILWQNSFSGGVSACNGTQWVDVSSHTNGQASSANAYQRAGIAMRGSRQSVIGGYERKGSTQLYGVEISNSADFPAVIGTQFEAGFTANIQQTTTPTHVLNQVYTTQHKRVAGCATSTTQFATCSVSFSWAAPFADTSYTPLCWAITSTGTGIVNASAKSASGLTIFETNLFSGTAFNASEIDCVGYHD